MEHGVERAIDSDVLRDVMVLELKSGLSFQVSEVSRVARQEVVHRDDFVPLGEEPIAEVAAEKSGAAGN